MLSLLLLTANCNKRPLIQHKVSVPVHGNIIFKKLTETGATMSMVITCPLSSLFTLINGSAERYFLLFNSASRVGRGIYAALFQIQIRVVIFIVWE